MVWDRRTLAVPFYSRIVGTRLCKLQYSANFKQKLKKKAEKAEEKVAKNIKNIKNFKKRRNLDNIKKEEEEENNNIIKLQPIDLMEKNGEIPSISSKKEEKTEEIEEKTEEIEEKVVKNLKKKKKKVLHNFATFFSPISAMIGDFFFLPFFPIFFIFI